MYKNNKSTHQEYILTLITNTRYMSVMQNRLAHCRLTQTEYNKYQCHIHSCDIKLAGSLPVYTRLICIYKCVLVYRRLIQLTVQVLIVSALCTESLANFHCNDSRKKTKEVCFFIVKTCLNLLHMYGASTKRPKQ